MNAAQQAIDPLRRAFMSRIDDFNMVTEIGGKPHHLKEVCGDRKFKMKMKMKMKMKENTIPTLL